MDIVGHAWGSSTNRVVKILDHLVIWLNSPLNHPRGLCNTYTVDKGLKTPFLSVLKAS